MDKILKNKVSLWLLIALGIFLMLLVILTRHYDAGSHNSIAAKVAPKKDEDHVDLTDSQLQLVKVATVAEQDFAARRDAVGSIAFNDERTVPVFPAYQGKIREIFTDVGRDVQKGQPLYSIESPDLLQAESTLIASAGTRELTTRALARAKQLYELEGIAQKDLQQAVSDQQTAEAAYQAALAGVRIFGKSDSEIEQMIAQHRVDAALVVRSPIAGRVVARSSAAPGVLVQPGTPPAPFTVADLSTMWMLANVAESDMPALKLGQHVEVRLMAYPDRSFTGTITSIGAAVDPNTHRATVRSAIRDPKHELLPGMLANFVITTGQAAGFPAVPIDSVVREGNGTLTVWVTQDHHHFVKRAVTIGQQLNGFYQVLFGLQPGEEVASEGAIFLSHAFETESH